MGVLDSVVVHSGRWLLASASAGLVGCGVATSGSPTTNAGPADGARGSTVVPEDASFGMPTDQGASAETDSGSGSSGSGSGSGSRADEAGPDAADAWSSEGGRADAAPSSGGSGEGGRAGPEQCPNRAPVAPQWTLQWSDEFDKDGAPDSANWVFESGFVRNQELQWYQSSSATVSGGLLTIAAQREQVTNPNYAAGSTDWTKNRQYAQYTSSSITTTGKRSFQYGRFEMCGQIDTRLGSWPAFWILGDGRGWPSSGEVDIMEYYANGVRANVCIPAGGNCDWSGSVTQSLGSLGGTTWSAQFHLWAMEWTATDVNLYLDDKLVYDFKVSRVTSAPNPYNGNAFHLLVNLAIGANGGDPTNTAFPMTYKVDYVRVYQ
jgi:beta-glucanase (GH16 family)